MIYPPVTQSVEYLDIGVEVQDSDKTVICVLTRETGDRVLPGGLLLLTQETSK